MKEFEAGHGYTKQDWDDVSDNPEWTEADFRRARPFREVFPELAARMKGGEARKGRPVPKLTDEEEARIQAGIAADPDNPDQD